MINRTAAIIAKAYADLDAYYTESAKPKPRSPREVKKAANRRYYLKHREAILAARQETHKTKGATHEQKEKRLQDCLYV